MHNIYNKDGEITGKQRFRFDYCESQGTQKLFELAGPLFEALRHGRLLVMDELDAKMHPLISQHIIKLFSSEKTNQHHFNRTSSEQKCEGTACHSCCKSKPK